MPDLKNIILDTDSDWILCEACRKLINPAQAKIIEGLAQGEYRVRHRECTEDPDHER
jgi:hypothetical protein